MNIGKNILLMDKYKISNIDAMDDPSNYRKWRDLEEEQDKLGFVRK